MNDTYNVFRLEKFVPTHCPKCAHHFRSNQAGDFKYDTRLMHSTQVAPEWVANFPEANFVDHLHAELIWCGRCHNNTLRVVTAVRYVVTREEIPLLESAGFVNCQTWQCSGSVLSRLNDYSLVIVPTLDEDTQKVTFMPRRLHRPDIIIDVDPPRSDT